MLRFCANLDHMYGRIPLEAGLARAEADGFDAVEFISPYEEEPESVARMFRRHSIQAVLFNTASGNRSAGERGFMILEGREKDFVDSIQQAIRYATTLNCRRINVVAGVNAVREANEIVFARLVERFSFAAEQYSRHGIVALLENLNPVDIPGCWVDTPRRALEVVKTVNLENARMQYDIYHAQRTAGNLVEFLRDNIEWIGHVQIADNPGRHQPGTGEIAFPFILSELERLGYSGWVGLEYSPDPNAADPIFRPPNQ